MESLKTIVITGANKGIGFGICENLYQKAYHIIMACRNVELGVISKEKLEKKYPLSLGKLEVRKCDISCLKSIEDFSNSIEKDNIGIDILLNNAGMAFKGDNFDEKIVRETLQTNFYGTVEITEKMLKNMRNNGKIICIGSSAGKTRILKNPELVKKFQDISITKEKLFELSQEFINDVSKGVYEKNGWPKAGYGVSKLLVNNYVRALCEYGEVKEKGLQVYCCCPGWVKTDMAGEKATLTIDEGALTPVYLVELPFKVDPALQGRFFEKKEVSEI